MTLLLVALATTRLVEWIKEVARITIRPWVKGGLTIVISIALCVGLRSDFPNISRTTILLGIASAGLASILRAVWRLLVIAGDERKTVVMGRSRIGR